MEHYMPNHVADLMPNHVADLMPNLKTTTVRKAPPYQPIPPQVFALRVEWLAQALAHALDPAAPSADPTLLTRGLDEWRCALHPTTIGTDNHGAYVEVRLMHTRGPNKGEPRSPRRVDPEMFWLLQAHLFFGGGLSLKRSAGRKVPERRLDYLALYAGDTRPDVARLVVDAPAGYVVPESTLGHEDYRRSGFPVPITEREYRRLGHKSRGAEAGREEAIAASLDRLERKPKVAAALELNRASYGAMLRQGYALLARMRPRRRQ
ncbi:MAG TPA: hypothetical protein VHI52_01590 [Verrucomicrobiae bacterium]|nr:hypothetical protein [Verrucomicrobiae bacterium]